MTDIVQLIPDKITNFTILYRNPTSKKYINKLKMEKYDI